MAGWNGFSVVRSGDVDTLTLEREDRLNAIDPPMAHDLTRYFAGLRSDRRCRIVTLRGAGRAFCSGVDLTAVRETPRSEQWGAAGVATELEIQTVNRQFILELRACPQIIVAEVNGVACGAGFALALAADLRLATVDAKMNCAFVRVGLGGCDIGVSYFLPRMIGAAAASDLILTGRFMSAGEAQRLGLIRSVHDDVATMRDAGATLVATLRRVGPVALRLSKEALRFALDAPSLDSVIAMEDRNQVLCARTEDFGEGLAAFVERRPPTWATA